MKESFDPSSYYLYIFICSHARGVNDQFNCFVDFLIRKIAGSQQFPVQCLIQNFFQLVWSNGITVMSLPCYSCVEVFSCKKGIDAGYYLRASNLKDLDDFSYCDYDHSIFLVCQTRPSQWVVSSSRESSFRRLLHIFCCWVYRSSGWYITFSWEPSPKRGFHILIEGCSWLLAPGLGVA